MESEFIMYFADFLRERRKEMGITQDELGRMVHVSKSAVTKWESGRGLPDRTNLRQLAKVLGISIDTLNKICEGETPDVSNELIINDIISVLEKHGYEVKRREE